MDDATLAALRLAASALVDVAFAAAVGALATALTLAGGASAWRRARERGALAMLGVAAGVALLGQLALLWIEAMTMAEVGPVAALGELRGVVVGTPWGHAWACASAALVLLLAARSGVRRGWSDLRVFAVLACVVFALARAGGGHAGASGLGTATVVMAVHLLATAAWAGLVFVGTLVVLRADAALDDPAPADRAAWLRWLSTSATIALVLVAGTGVAAAWRETGPTLAPLLSSGWGFVLDAKLALVALAVALGAHNRFVALPPLLAALADARPATELQRRFARVLRVEAVVLLAALLAAAALANGEPPPVAV